MRTELVLSVNRHQWMGFELQPHLVLQNLDQDVIFISLTSFRLYFEYFYNIFLFYKQLLRQMATSQ